MPSSHQALHAVISCNVVVKETLFACFSKKTISAYVRFESQMDKTLFGHSNLPALTLNEHAAYTQFALEVADIEITAGSLRSQGL